MARTRPFVRAVNLKIAPGEVIGIVGRSGSGKNTLAKLVQRLDVPDRGRVLIDGQDIAIIDTASLHQRRRRPQETSCSTDRSGTILRCLIRPCQLKLLSRQPSWRERTSLSVSFPKGMTAWWRARHGAVGRPAPKGRDCPCPHHQPARSDLRQATSALDYESEKIIQNNMRKICAGRAVLIIAHRLLGRGTRTALS